uniref:Uncharacterized protein n=1 Tax=Populus alba TaxID=43335 RepID=A0A4U5QV42_POPAL|nr:hypothetical protein D5086_0000038780 [Populus alba]
MVVRGNYNMSKGRQNNLVPGYQSNNSRNKEPFQCTYCGDMYHRKATCYKLIGYPPGHPKSKEKASHQRQGYNKHSASGNPSANQVDFNPTFQELQASLPNLTEDQYDQILSALTTKPVTTQANVAAASAFQHTSGLLPVAHNRWILDSGATHHITSSPTSLKHVDKNLSLAPVSLPSGDVANITDLATRTMIGVGKRRNDLYYLVALASTPPSTPHNPPALPIPVPIMSDPSSHLPSSSVTIDPFDSPISSSPAPTDSVPSLPEPLSSTPLNPPAAQQTPVQPADSALPEPTLVQVDQPLRRSQRPREVNVRLKDYVCSQVILPPHQLSLASSAPPPVVMRNLLRMTLL